MSETSQPVDIPDRALFRAAEVCSLAKVQPYVLRSWEAEFKDLGVARAGSSTRVYRRADVERVLRIKHLLLIEGLTLAGVRRKLEEEAEAALELADLEPIPSAAQTASRARLSDADRDGIGRVKEGLRSLLVLLDRPAPRDDRRDAAQSNVLDFAAAQAPTSILADAGGRDARPAARARSKVSSPRGKRST